jgi:hypothetical protein
MAYNAVPTVATSDSWTASQHNTYIKDNFAAIWVGTSAGDLDYYTSGATKARLEKPSVDSLLKMGSGGTPSWHPMYEFCHVTRSSNFSHSSGVITWNSEIYDAGNWHDNSTNTDRITVPADGIYRIGGILVCQMPSGGSVDRGTMTFHKNGSSSSSYRFEINQREDDSEKTILGITPPLSLSANDYWTMQASFEVGTKSRTIDASRSAFWIERLR